MPVRRPFMRNGKKYYLVSQVCAMLGIFKNTLYNWERTNKIPKAYRDPMSGWRLYAQEDVAKILALYGKSASLELSSGPNQEQAYVAASVDGHVEVGASTGGKIEMA